MTDYDSSNMIGIAHDIWNGKYRFEDEKNVNETWLRVAHALSMAEKPSEQYQWEHEFCKALEDFKFIPAGRILAGAGTGRTVTYFNCFVMNTIADSMDGIFQGIKEAALTMQQGGGVGMDFSSIRPKGAPVLGVGADASGPLSFMDVWDSMCRTIMSAGARRGAMMGCLRCDHPDIEDFIEIKRNPLKLRMFNISVLVTDDFMEAVETNINWDLKFGGVIYKTVRARDLWDRITQGTYDCAEPGVIFIDRINNNNNLKYCETISATNPCFTGDTLVWTGEGPKTFKELAKTEADVKVLTQLPTGKLVFRTMHKPRLTQSGAKLVEVLLDDGTKIRCTPNHKFFLKNGNIEEAINLKPRARVASVYRWVANKKGYMRISNGIDQSLEHRVPFEIDFKGLHVHHKNEIKRDNRISNLELKDISLHMSEHILGDNNPMRRFPERNHMRHRNNSGANNFSYRHDLSDDEISNLRAEGLSYGAIAEKLSCSKYTVMKRLGWNRPTNHQVVSVTELPDREDVYCGTVEETGRFFIHCKKGGVLVSNCAEQPLPPWGACLLGSINLSAFVTNAFEDGARIDFDLLESTVTTAIRMLDNVIDVSNFPLQEQAKEARAKRRIGLGITGLADTLTMLRCKYGSRESLIYAGETMRFITRTAYKASMNLAKEKGAFPLYDNEKHKQMPFVRAVLTDMIRCGDIETPTMYQEYGIRNSHLTSIAPTGTISLLAGNISSGVEPIFGWEYERKVLQPDGSHKTEKVTDFAVRKWRDKFGENTPLADYFVTAHELTPGQHISMQAALQPYVDSAISKTVNCPEDIPFEEFQSLYRDSYNLGLKCCAAYRPNEITGSILSIPEEDKETDGGAANISEGGRVYNLTHSDGSPVLAGHLVAEQEYEIKLEPRPAQLTGTTYKIKWPPSPHAFYIVINDIEQVGAPYRRPYEVFINSKNLESHAWTVALTRMISAIFRRGGDMAFVIEELKAVFDPKGGAWVDGKYVPSLLAAIGDVIGKHIGSYYQPEDANIPLVTSGVPLEVVKQLDDVDKECLSLALNTMTQPPFCPKCFSSNFRQKAGCIECLDCGHSNCS